MLKVKHPLVLQSAGLVLKSKQKSQDLVPLDQVVLQRNLSQEPSPAEAVAERDAEAIVEAARPPPDGFSSYDPSVPPFKHAFLVRGASTVFLCDQTIHTQGQRSNCLLG